MAVSDDLALGRLAVQRGMLSAGTVDACLAEQERLRTGGRYVALETLLRERRLLSEAQLQDLRSERRTRRFLAAAVPAGLREPIDELLCEEPAGTPTLRRYDLHETIGEGGAAVVYRATDRDLHRRVAVKVLKNTLERYDVACRRFAIESRAAARLTHQNIVTLYDAGEENGRMFMVMELVAGRPLSVLLRERRTDRDELLAMLEKVAHAVQYAHENGVVHRDLKPANILMSETGEPKVADFGLAFLPETRAALTETGVALGTPSYMAPEQVLGLHDRVGPHTDVHALGAILYELLTGRPPHVAASTYELFRAIVSDTPQAPRHVRPGLARDLETVCLKAIEKAPGRRYRSAAAFADDLGRARRGEPIAARPQGALRWIGRRARRVPVLPALVLVAVAVAAGWWSVATSSHAGRVEALRERLRPIAVLLAETRPHFYSAGTDVVPHLERVAAALDELEALGRTPEGATSAELWSMLGAGRHLLGESDRAREALERALQLDGANVAARCTLARIDLEAALRQLIGPEEDESERVDRSQRHLDAAAAHLHAPPGRWEGAGPLDRHLADTYRALAQQRGEDVKRLCDDGLSRFRGEMGVEEFHVLRAVALTGDARQRECDRALAIRPHYPFVFWLRGECKRRAGNLVEAIKDLDAALRIHPRLAGALNDRGMIRQALGDFQRSLADLDEAVRLRPDDATAYVNRGNSRHGAGDSAGAIADYEHAMRLDPSYVHAYGNRGNIRREQGDLAAALKDYDRAIELRPGDAPLRVNRGLAHVDRRDFDAALADFDRALELDARNTKARRYRAGVRASRGDRRGALEDLELLIAASPDDVQPRMQRGELHLAAQEDRLAAADFTRVIEIDARRTDAWVNRGIAKSRCGDLPGGIADLDQALRLDPSSVSAYANRAESRRMAGDPAGAIEDCTAALRLDPAHHWATTIRAHVYRVQRDLASARRDFTRALQILPDCASCLAWRGCILGYEGDVQGALADLERALALDAKCVRAWSGRAEVRARQGQLRGAIDDLGEAIALDPGDRAHLMRRVELHVQAGDMRLAEADCSQLIAGDPTLVMAWYGRALARRRIENLPGALADLDEALRLAPSNAEARATRGAIHLQRGDRDRARDDYRRALETAPPDWKLRAEVEQCLERLDR